MGRDGHDRKCQLTVARTASAWPHGTTARYGSGCRCSACSSANTARHRAYMAQRRRLDAEVALVDAASAREQVVALAGAGLGYREVAERAGLPSAVVASLAAGRTGSLAAGAADRVDAVAAATPGLMGEDEAARAVEVIGLLLAAILTATASSLARVLYRRQSTYDLMADLLGFRPEPWREDGRCRRPGVDARILLDGNWGSSRETARARRICAACPVRDECLDVALDRGEDFGMWGGLTPAERRALRESVNLAP